jgi:hypothetical protein
VLTLSAPENIEAVGDAAILYESERDLARQLQRVLRDGSLVHSYRNRAQTRVQQHYHWEGVVDQYERLFAEMAGQPLPRAHSTIGQQDADLKAKASSLKNDSLSSKTAAF